MGTVTQFPRKPKQDSVPSKEVIISIDTYKDYKVAWMLLKQLSLVTEPNRASLTAHQRELLTVADQLPATPGHRKGTT